MYSLVTKIFLAFWLTALLLLGALVAAQRYMGQDVVDEAIQRTDAHAATVSALLADDGMPAVQRWLQGVSRGERAPLFLLDAEGHPLPGLFPPHHRWRDEPERRLEPGVHTLRPGLLSIVRPVPASSPPLYLGTLAHVEPSWGLPLWARILIATAVSGLVSLGLAALITRPVRRLRRAAQALAAGDLTVRVPAGGRDEVAALARDFNLMADRVRDLLESQKRLLRDVSHELRSPLARLRVALELARKKGDATALMDRFEREADRLESLVGDVLSLARLEARQTRLQRQSVALDELLAAVAQDAAFEAEAAHKQVRTELDAGISVMGDPVLLRSAVENVVRNGVRHTPEGSAVLLRLRRVGNQAQIDIEDQGSGVPPGELDRLFQPFTRVGEARDRASGGYGLGLAITRQAMEAHGGRVVAINRPEGGLRISLMLTIENG
jgi:signal transduction histidine kinase